MARRPAGAAPVGHGVKPRDPGMHPASFRNALRNNPDGNRIGMGMLLDNDPNTYRPGKGKKARRTNRKRTK